MPDENVKKQAGLIFPLKPTGGVDYFTDAAGLDPRVLSRGENLYSQRGVVERRPGAQKLVQLVTPGTTGASRTFGTTGKYATIPPAAQLLIPYGGFALMFHITAVRGATTGQILHGQDGADSVPPFDMSLGTDGRLSFVVNWAGGGTDGSSFTDIIADGATVHGLYIYDPIVGTIYTAINGTLYVPEVTGTSLDKRPVQTASMTWLVGVKKTAAAVVSLPFAGKADSFTLFTMRGTRHTSTSSIVETYRRNSARTWPSPFMENVLFHYDFDEASGTTMYDRSNYKNHGTYVGGPAVTTPVAQLAAPGNLIDRIEVNGNRYNVAGSFGSLWYEAIGGLV